MSSRYAAARPKRAGEQFARTHHGEGDDGGPSSTKKPKFDLRNPSALAPDAPEEDAILEADVIGSGPGMKRGAVNIDGYDSDSDNEGFDARAEERAKGKKGEVSLADAFEYGKDGIGKGEQEDEDDDMFGDLEEDEVKESKTKKSVTFLEADEIEGQVESSKSGGHISGNFVLDPKGKLSTHAMDDQLSSDDEEDAALALQEEDIDAEVGLGGLKRNAPKVDAFNMKAEQEEGRFDSAGNFVRKANDPDAKHDMWLEGVSKKEMRKAAEAHEKREEELRKRRLEDDMVETKDVLGVLIGQLEKGETVLEALARLGRGQKKEKKVPKWKLKKMKQQNRNGNGNGGEEMDVDSKTEAEDPEQVRIKEAVDVITGAADQLLTRGQTEIYEQEREMLIRQYRREAGEDWAEPKKEEMAEEGGDVKMWEYRWIDGRDGAAKQGPYDGATMVAWQDAGYFGEGVEFRREGKGGPWDRVVDFV
ncbi:Lin1 family protein [Drepanopeziza brunnea f. sp. 'multigermtubi' MB_m1]|uniref:Lin1 family protein n=1 Tax=Marssonina brunnea f. sp. multigermtubi (strain MB_m1) TaxID=1072389 RepID=K1WUW2_MARBU|nr:Lin1 family protein [Drepanopeziza brunnea f. sp. 'multigermtubi' MB_m1]EKD16212.1 Lin1 family protein [Drepanopeziza brunnea f. sp. 'multigermtubi' MB_m1]